MDNIIECPHCQTFVIIKELNCAIFRHGVYKNSYKQVDPHLQKDLCDKLIEQNIIYGCGKPFKIVIENDKYNAIICDYI
jgi:hypothetical protein